MRPLFFFKQAMEDIRTNKLPHALAMSTISLIFLLAGSFALIFVNVAGLMSTCRDNVRIMVYLDNNVSGTETENIKQNLLQLPDVNNVTFIPKAQALLNLAKSMKQQAGLLEDLAQNPLPDAFEVLFSPGREGWDRVRQIARQMKKIPGVEQADFGQSWLERFAVFEGMARMIAVVMGSLLLVAALSITANTIRLVLYNRREEIRLMELVGATNGFIRASFYIQGMLQGFCGGVIAIGLLAAIFYAVAAGLPTHELLGRFEPRFLPAWQCFLGLAVSVLVGAAGCHISFAQFQKE